MNIDQFDFNLPEDLIAQQPVNPRHNSKLLSCINSELGDFHFYDLPNLLNPGDVIVVNDTKVLKAKLIGLVNEKKLSFNLHMKKSEDQWYSFCKPAKKCRKNDEVYFSKSFKINYPRVCTTSSNYKFRFIFNCQSFNFVIID